MINIKNRQKKIKYNTEQYKKKAEKILTYLGYSEYDLGIWLTTDATVRKYNREYRNKDKSTDILSFPYHTDLQAGETITVHEEEDKNIGDIIISMLYVYENKNNLDGTFEQRMDRMLVHGICHLLGYDHIEEDDYKVMHTLEMKLLKLINN